jgi:hypothetical protein
VNGDFEPEIVRKIKKTVHHLSSDSESKCVKKYDSDNKSEVHTPGGDKNKSLFQNLNSRV